MINERIKKELEEKKISQAELSRITGISTGSISQYVTGQFTPKIDNLRKIAKALDVSVEYLTGKTNTKSIEPYKILINKLNELTYKNTIVWEEEGLLVKEFFPYNHYFTSIANVFYYLGRDEEEEKFTLFLRTISPTREILIEDYQEELYELFSIIEIQLSSDGLILEILDDLDNLDNGLIDTDGRIPF